MLSESSYLTAIYSYAGASVAILLYMAWWLSRHWRAGWVAFTVLVLAALLLTPAHPNADIQTFAPALIVAVFETLTHGPEAAEHAFKPLSIMLMIATVLAIVLRLTIFRRTAVQKQSSETGNGADLQGE
ncbi:MAG: hypothetical protein V7746_23840 [Halioglobus sp.]